MSYQQHKAKKIKFAKNVCISFFLLTGLLSVNLQAKTQTLSHAEAQKKIQELEKKLKQDESKLDWRTLGKLYLALKNEDKAIKALNNGLDDTKPETYFILSDYYKSKKQYFDEIRVLNIILPKHPTNAEILLRIAQSYESSGKNNEAMDKYKEIIKAKKDFEPAYWSLLELYQKANNHYESRVVLDDIIKIFGPSQKSLALMCKFHTIDSYYDAAKTYCQAAVSNDPKVPENHIYLGLVLKYQNEVVKSEQIILKTAKDNPKNEFAQQVAGQILEEQSNWEKAKNAFSFCISNNSKNLICQKGIANSMFQIGMYNEAIPHFTAACKLDRSSITDFKKMATSLRLNKKESLAARYDENISKCYD